MTDADRRIADRRIAELEAENARLRAAQLPSSVAGDAVGNDKVAGDKVSRDKQQGAVHVSGDGRANAAVGVNQGTIQLFFGAHPPPEAKALLDAYLRSLIEDHGTLRLGKLLEADRGGHDQAALPEIALLSVYTALTTDVMLPGELFSLDGDALREALDAANPDQVLPDKVRVPLLIPEIGDKGGGGAGHPMRSDKPFLLGERPLSELWQQARRETALVGGARAGRWYQPEDVLRAIRRRLEAPYTRVVLLGSPGSGKSTSLRRLAVFLATALRSGTKTFPIPFFCPLGPVAQSLSDDPDHDLDALVRALLRPVLGPGELRAGLREQVLAAIASGAAFLFFDGLDEVSGAPEPTRAGSLSRRARVADALRTFARQVGSASVVVTCRTLPYRQSAAWQLRQGWAERRLQPFAFGQVRDFIHKWYGAVAASGESRYTHEEAQGRAERLVALLEQPDRATLRELAATPLLLTMLVLLDYNNTRMPERRADVYEELVKLLLDRWEGVRSSDVDRRPLRIGERLGLRHLAVDDLRPVIYQLAFEAHRQSIDGRGVLTGALLRDKLDQFFARKLNPAQPKDVMADAARPRELFMRLLLEESGLLLEEADETYVLPHLTFEEYLAACHLAALESRGVDLAYAQWVQGGDRWREVARLLMGRLLRQEKYDNLIAWLCLLVAARARVDKPPLQRQRDLLLAADCYAAVERRAAFATTVHDLSSFERDLRDALQALVEQPDPALTLPERIEAATALADLGDPRFPVIIDEWRRELARCNQQFGQPAGYWCFVPGGSYQIGGWPAEDDADRGVAERLRGAVRRLTRGASSAAIVLKHFWVARFAITNAQFARFVEEGYGDAAKQWWTAEGWRWKNSGSVTMGPRRWNDGAFNALNQPIVSVSIHEMIAFCNWLSAQLGDALPPGYALRLPREAEWEAAASYGAGDDEHRPFPWGDTDPTTELAVYNAAKLGSPAPVGCCPAGAAACGALDMAGNVWEATLSDYDQYPAGSNLPAKAFTNVRIAWRGGSYYSNSTYVRCGARNGVRDGLVGNGFRLVVAPRLAHTF